MKHAAVQMTDAYRLLPTRTSTIRSIWNKREENTIETILSMSPNTENDTYRIEKHKGENCSYEDYLAKYRVQR